MLMTLKGSDGGCLTERGARCMVWLRYLLILTRSENQRAVIQIEMMMCGCRIWTEHTPNFCISWINKLHDCSTFAQLLC